MPIDLGPFVSKEIAEKCEPLSRVTAALQKKLAVDVAETYAAARPALVSALWRQAGGQFIVWTATPDAADRYVQDCGTYLGTDTIVRSLRPRDAPSIISSPTDRSARLEALAALASGERGIYCVPYAALRQPVMPGAAFTSRSLRLSIGDTLDWERLLRTLADLGYERAEVVSAVGEFAVRGGLVDIFPATADVPVRLEFFGDRLDSARTFSLTDQRSTGSIDGTFISPWAESAGAVDFPSTVDFTSTVIEYAPDAIVAIDDPEMITAVDRTLRSDRDAHTVAAADLEPEVEVAPARPEDDLESAAQVRPLQSLREAVDKHAVVTFAPALETLRVSRTPDVSVSVACGPAPAYGRSIDRFVADVRRRAAAGELVAVITVGHRRIREVLAENNVAVSADSSGRLLVGDGVVDEGFELPHLRLTVLCDAELFGHPARRHRPRTPKEGVPVSETELGAGDYLVHAYHGIGQYLGLEHLAIDGVGRDFLLLKYAGNDRLYVPVDQMHYVRKYIAGDAAPPRLSKMGGSDWTRTRSKVREAVDKIAEGLIELYAARELAVGYAFAPDTVWQTELEEAFPYDETPDQSAAISAIKADMELPRPMDRLVCGDVGYGKTEVAIRAAFKAIMDRKQVAVLAPTTVLAAQHLRTFSERFAAFPANIAALSRLRSKAEQRATLGALADGNLDLVIGTHRLLQKDVAFARLGLVIVDEEQRFGVAHKEKLKELRTHVDVLTLSATPIPRTLHMAMTGIRDLSLIQTAPENRVAVKTIVTPTSDALIGRAIAQELDRGGQVYFVHNRIETIHGVAAAVQRLAPRARIGIGHGKMRGPELEDLMIAFVNGDFDVLVSTTIIENGLDIPNVNTIIVNNADKFGLAQLYQLRGRVGRSAHQAYAYLLYQPHRSLTETAQRRLEAIREFSHLGSGLRLAMRDLEIRGAGNVLGREQSGFIASVGFDEYCRILQEVVAERRAGTVAQARPLQIDAQARPLLQIDLHADAYIPDSFIAAQNQKFAFYQRLAAAETLTQVETITDEMRDRFGPLPKETLTLLEIARMRVVAAAKGVEKVALEGRRLTLEVGRRFSLSEQALAALKSITKGNFRFTHSAIVAHLPSADGSDGDGGLTAVREIVAAL